MVFMHQAEFLDPHGVRQQRQAGRVLTHRTAEKLHIELVDVLRHIGEGAMADRVMAALRGVLADGQVLTRDLGGRAGTIEFTEAICRRLQTS